MQKYSEERFNRAINILREKCIRSPRSFRARALNTIINKIGKLGSPRKITAYNEKNDEVIDFCQLTVRKKAICPTTEDFMSLNVNKLKDNEKKIDIICPIYRGYGETLRCIYSVLNAKTDINYELIVINDKSPDEALTHRLRELSKNLNFTYIENEINKGFLNTTNYGMLLHPDRDVVWLNSDTEVFDYWLDSLLEIAEKNPLIGTITPISNNATIASYPRQVTDNCTSLEISDAQLNAICRRIGKNAYVEAPTGIGYCMYIRRSILTKVGMLDEVFNLGYGEENDLCQRIIKNGYVNVLTPSTFVRHYGSISFKEASVGLCRENAKILNRKHPNYNSDVKEWIQQDPMSKYRIILDAARLLENWKKNQIKDPKEIVLHVSHNRGGGTETFIKDLIQRSLNEDIASFVLVPLDDSHCMLLEPTIDVPNVLHINYAAGAEEVEAILIGLCCTKIHVHSLVDWDLCIANIIQTISLKLKIPYIISIHDYHWCCSKINLKPSLNKVCLDPKNANCFFCNRNEHESTFKLRCASEKFFKGAHRIIAPSFDTANRIKSVFSNSRISIDVVPHAYDYKLDYCHKSNNVFNICVIGNISDVKGLDVLERLSNYIVSNKICSRVIVIGRMSRKVENIEYLGSYKDLLELSEKLKKARPSLMFLPSVWPETFCYTLSEMLQSGVPIACFDIGAPAERLKAIGLEQNLVPLHLHHNPALLYRKLELIARQSPPVKEEKKRDISVNVYYR